MTALDAGWDALHRRGSLIEARAHFDAAYRRAEQEGRPDVMIDAAIGLGGVWVHEHRGAAETALVRRRQRQALALASPGSSQHLQLRLRIVAEDDYSAARHDRILALLPEARELGDPQVLAAALSLAHHCLLAPEHAALRQALADEMAEVATASPRPGDLTMAMTWQAVDRFLAADPHSERALSDLMRRLHGSPHLAAGFIAKAMAVMVNIRAGQLTDAERQASECARLGEAAGDVDAQGWFAAHIIAIRWYQGRIGELLPQLEAQANSPTLSTIDNSGFGALAVAAASAGDRRRAVLALSRLGGGDLSKLPRSSSWMVAVYGAVEAATLLRSNSVARAGYDLLLPFAGRPMMVSLAVTCFGSVELALGMAALGMGSPELATRHLRAAVSANLALGHWPAAVHSRYRLGQALADSEDRDHREEGASEQACALAQAEEQGWILPGTSRQSVRVATVPAVTRASEKMAVGPSHDRGAVLQRFGRRWRLHWGDRSAEVDHTVGMMYLAVLLAHPAVDIPAADLAAGQVNDRDVRADARIPAQPLIDDDARRRYRRRLSTLEQEIRDTAARDSADTGLARLRQERDWLAAELTSSTGLSQRRRTFVGNAERARISVGKAIRRAITRISEADAVIGEELRRTVQTGTNCCYRPPVSAHLARGVGPRETTVDA
ncbi:MAG TPA: hypothetical protein VI248_05615 [Kineosporiaceae bacterium]